MKESAEKIVKIGFKKDPKIIFDEIEYLTADMIRQGWSLCETCMEDGLAQVHLFFERDIN